MDLDLSDDQRSLDRLARTVFAAECPPDVVRRSGEPGVLDTLWKRLAEVDLLAVGVPEEYGGLGLGDVELAVVAEAAGEVCLPGPLLETAVAAFTVAESGSLAQRQRWLRPLGEGRVRAALALPGQSVVAWARDADVLLLGHEDGVHLVPAGRFDTEALVSRSGVRPIDRLAAHFDPTTRLDGGRATVGRLVDRTAVACAATLLGLATRMVAMSVEHVRSRHQFGRPVGSFQAVKHRLAEAHRGIETSRPALWAAAQLLTDSDPDAGSAASVAAIAAIAAAAAANEHALQCHGGVGFTLEHDLHLWLLRAKVLERAYGTAAAHRTRLAAELFDRPTEGEL